MMVLFALLLAAVAGFAAQRGSICAVAAVTDLVVRRDGRRYLALLEAALWSLAITGAVSAVAQPPSFVNHPATYLAAAGGALFGAGAVVNGACTFGSAARLARGQLDYLFMPFGMIAGAYISAQLVARPAAISGAAIESPAAALLVLFVGWRIFGALDHVRSFAAMRTFLQSPRWPPAAAMAAVGASSAILMFIYAPWPYSTLLVSIAVNETGPETGKKALIALLFVAGAALAALQAGAFKLRRPRLIGALQKFSGGALMGAGAFLIPGGNDALVLSALPNLFLYGFIAYGAMTASIAVIVLAAGSTAPVPD